MDLSSFSIGNRMEDLGNNVLHSFFIYVDFLLYRVMNEIEKSNHLAFFIQHFGHMFGCF